VLAAVAVGCGGSGNAQDVLARSRSQALSTGIEVTGGGTVLAAPTFASFGLNARRSGSFGGSAEGRINYDKHANVAGRHVNVPVVLMEGTVSSNLTPNGTGGS